MPRKNAVQFWFGKDTDTRLDKRRSAENSRLSRVAFAEGIILDYLDGKLVPRDTISTEKLFVTMLGMGIIDQRRFDQLLKMIRSGALSASVPKDKFGLAVEGDPGPESKK